MLNVKYETLEEASLRLKDSVVMYDGEPVYIFAVTRGEPYRLHFTKLPLIPVKGRVNYDDLDEFKIFSVGRAEGYFTADGASRKFISSKNFDAGVSTIGYVSQNNNQSGPVRVSRRVARQYRQGLCSRNVEINLDIGDISPSFTDLITQQSFADALKGQNENETMKLGPDTPYGVISKDFYWHYDRVFRMRWLINSHGQKVAMASPDGDKFYLPEKFAFHKEQLDELGIPYTLKEQN